VQSLGEDLGSFEHTSSQQVGGSRLAVNDMCNWSGANMQAEEERRQMTGTVTRRRYSVHVL